FAGVDHVGIGSDFDGIAVPPLGLENISKIGVIFEELRRRNFSERNISKIAGGNFLRVFNEVRAVSRQKR
ncbi:MAG: membrane dipeptidase, partial [Bacteroidales bacterium]